MLLDEYFIALRISKVCEIFSPLGTSRKSIIQYTPKIFSFSPLLPAPCSPAAEFTRDRLSVAKLTK